MLKKRVYISSRIAEVRDFREAAIRAIEKAGMEPVFYDSSDPKDRFRLKPNVPILRQLLESVRTSDAFVGIYGQTLDDSWTPPGGKKHAIESEYETAQRVGLPCFCYVVPNGYVLDADMTKFRGKVLRRAIDFLSTPDALGKDLRVKFRHLKRRIFISYSSRDQKFVDGLTKSLRQSGWPVWLNTQSIHKGGRWHDEMVDGLRDTELMILVVSKSSMASRWVKEEWTTFLKSRKTIVPVLLRPCETPRPIGQLEMVKTSGPGWYDQVLKTLEQRL